MMRLPLQIGTKYTVVSQLPPQVTVGKPQDRVLYYLPKEALPVRVCLAFNLITYKAVLE